MNFNTSPLSRRLGAKLHAFHQRRRQIDLAASDQPAVRPDWRPYRVERERGHAERPGIARVAPTGEHLIVAIRKFFYSDVSAILLMIVATVMLIDMLSARVRHQLATETQR